MAVEVAKKHSAAAHPSGDKRCKLLEGAMKRRQFQQHALIDVLHAAHDPCTLGAS